MTLMFEDENKHNDSYFWRGKQAMTYFSRGKQPERRKGKNSLLRQLKPKALPKRILL